MQNFWRKSVTAFLALMCIAVIFLCLQVFENEMYRRQLKEDAIELSRIKYGLFSVDQWKEIVSGIVSKKVQEFDFEESSREEMKQKITTLLYKVLDDFEESYHEEKSQSLMGILERSVASFTGVFGKMRKDVPVFAEQILTFMDNPENREGVRNYIVNQLDTYADETFAEIDYTTYNAVLTKYDQAARPDAMKIIRNRLQDTIEDNRPNAFVLFGLLFLTMLCLFLVKPTSLEYLLLTLISFSVLTAGVLLPMIDIDARIEHMQFTLLGEPVEFYNQVLFYKSKSILEVTELLLRQGKSDLILVGVLIFSFSVFFPVMKLLTGLIYAFRQSVRSSRFIKFMVFKTGKWSMADVMVVAIFMAFIGFSGIVSEQLRQIETIAANMEVVSTNQSALQVGFFLFTAFVLLSLFISQKLQNQFSMN